MIIAALIFALNSFIIAMRYDLKCKGGTCFWYGWFCENLMPHFGNLFFIPLLLNLFMVFQCTRFIEEGTFLETVCENYCWSADHIVWVAFCGLASTAFTIASTALRPFWQIYQYGLNIKGNPTFLLFKSLL
jgi:hypothetical protein